MEGEKKYGVYVMMIVANATYIILFYWVMKSFA